MDNKCLSGTGTTSEGVGVLVFDVSPADFETRPEKKNYFNKIVTCFQEVLTFIAKFYLYCLPRAVTRQQNAMMHALGSR